MNEYGEIQFVETDPDALVQKMTAKYEALTGKTLHPGDPMRLVILWAANIIVQERVNLNWTARQNIPRFSEGAYLDMLADLFHDTARKQATPATTRMRFYLSEKLGSAQLVPVGTKVTADGSVIFETTEDMYIPARTLSGEVPAQCQTTGEAGNGFLPGQIRQVVDRFPFCERCENITASAGGAEQESDTNFYLRLRASQDAYSTAGSVGGYEYHAKSASTTISDVRANTPAPGRVNIYVLTEGGKLPDQEIIDKVKAGTSADKVRAFTDQVEVLAPETVPYNIDLTYYIPSNSETSAKTIEEAVATAVETFCGWQCARMGRDINPSQLTALLMQAGVKRAVIRAPVFTEVNDGRDNTAAQVAALGTVSVLNGGYEDE